MLISTWNTGVALCISLALAGCRERSLPGEGPGDGEGRGDGTPPALKDGSGLDRHVAGDGHVPWPADLGPFPPDKALPWDLGFVQEDAVLPPPPPEKYMIWLAAYEVVGSTASVSPLRLMEIWAEVERDPPLLTKPDFIDWPVPPNCVGYAWSKGQVPSRTSWDAGKLFFSGHQPVLYDPQAGSQPQPLPPVISCSRQPIPNTSPTLYTYNCGLPATTVLASSMFQPTTTLEMGASGSADVPAFTETGVKVAQAPLVITNLAQLDPGSAIEIAWFTPVAGAVLAQVKLHAALADGSQLAEITCTTLSLIGSKTIPAGALALVPKPSAQNPLVLRTDVVGLSIKGKTSSWGSYILGAGQGVFGLTCRSPSGLVPCP